jgi:hypothetical protein
VKTKEATVWTVFLDFWILGGGLWLWPRVFTVLSYPDLFDQMLRAATVVLNKFCPKETLPIIVDLSSLGCMYLKSPRRPHPLGLKVPQLRTQSNPLPKKPVIIAIGVQGRNWKKQNSVLTEATIPPSVLTNFLSIHEIENKILVFDGGDIDNPPIKPPDGVDRTDSVHSNYQDRL